MKVTAILLKPLDGDAEGSERDFDKPDFDRLEAMGAVRLKKTDKPADEGEEKPAAKRTSRSK